MGTNILRKLGTAIDRLFLKKVGAISVPGSEYHLLLICFHPYYGQKTVQIPDQVTIAPGDPLCEIHLSNQRITAIAAETEGRSMEWRLFEILKAEFGKLAKACADGTIPEIKAVYGINTMRTATKRLGFTLFPIPKGFSKLWLGFWESLLRKVFYSYKKDKKAAIKRRTMKPYEIWLSREELIRKYLKT